MGVKDVREALSIAKFFIESDYRGPFASLDSFEPISVKFDENNKKWIIVCKFEKKGKPYRAKVEIDSETRNIITYELLEE